MAVKEILFKRHIAQDELCQCCGIEVESVNHVLFEWETLSEVWENNQHRSLIEATPEGQFASKLVWWMNQMSVAEVREIMTVAWAMWFCRNKLIYAHESVDRQLMAINFLRLVEDYIAYAQKVFSPPLPRPIAGMSAASWQKPPHGVIKINVDAHIMAGQYVSVGVVVRDSVGSVQMMATNELSVVKTQPWRKLKLPGMG